MGVHIHTIAKKKFENEASKILTKQVCDWLWSMIRSVIGYDIKILYKTYLIKIKKIISSNILNLFFQLIVNETKIAFILIFTERNRFMESDEERTLLIMRKCQVIMRIIVIL